MYQNSQLKLDSLRRLQPVQLCEQRRDAVVLRRGIQSFVLISRSDLNWPWPKKTMRNSGVNFMNKRSSKSEDLFGLILESVAGMDRHKDVTV